MSLGNRLNTRNKAEREYKSQAFDLQEMEGKRLRLGHI